MHGTNFKRYQKVDSKTRASLSFHPPASQFTSSKATTFPAKQAFQAL